MNFCWWGSKVVCSRMAGDDGEAGCSSTGLGVGRRCCLLKFWPQTQAVGSSISKVLVADCSFVFWMRLTEGVAKKL